MVDIMILIMEWVGTVAFSVSGSLIAIGCGLDLFGVVFVGCITSVGGGILRDVILGHIPPQIFSDVYILAVSAFTAVLVFIISYLNVQRFGMLEKRIKVINNVFDAVGLAAFSVIGTESTCAQGYYDKAILAISMGMLTGVGGGIIRDIMVDKTPYVLKKHIYAVASILGSSLYYFLRMFSSKIWAISVAVSAVIIIRLLAIKFCLELPKIKLVLK